MYGITAGTSLIRAVNVKIAKLIWAREARKGSWVSEKAVKEFLESTNEFGSNIYIMEAKVYE